MSTPSYTNYLLSQEVSMGLEHWLIAPQGTTWDKTRVDVASPPAGFLHLGAVVDDSVSVRIQKQKYQLFVGIPRILGYEQTMMLQGEASSVLISNGSFHAFMGTGGAAPLHNPVTAHSTANPTVTSTSVTRTLVSVSTTAGFSVGRPVVTDTSSAIAQSYNVAYIDAIDTTAGTLTLSTDGLPFAPVSGHPIFQIGRDDLLLGTKLIPYFHLLGVADFTDNTQIVHDFAKATPRGDWTEQIIVGREDRISATFDLFGYLSTEVTGNSENVVGVRREYR